MNFFKYSISLFLILFSQLTYSAYTCGVGANVILSTNMDDYPSTICANVGGNNCLVSETHSEKTSSGWTVYAKSTGEACSSPTNLNPPKQPDDGCTRLPDGSITCPEKPDEPDPPTVLQCTTDACPNPNNLRCPSGYVKGSYNGQNLCVKSSKPDNPDPENPDDGQGTAEIINAIDQANSDISGSFGELGESLKGMFGDLTDLLREISGKLTNISNGDGSGNGNDWGGDVDTSGLEANIPLQPTQTHKLKENLFNSNAQCPPDNILSLNFSGHTITHKFSYVEICNALNMLSFLVMIGAYLLAVHIIVTKT